MEAGADGLKGAAGTLGGGVGKGEQFHPIRTQKKYRRYCKHKKTWSYVIGGKTSQNSNFQPPWGGYYDIRAMWIMSKQ